jgi:hypothetical protein
LGSAPRSSSSRAPSGQAQSSDPLLLDVRLQRRPAAEALLARDDELGSPQRWNLGGTRVMLLEAEPRACVFSQPELQHFLRLLAQAGQAQTNDTRANRKRMIHEDLLS